MTSSPTITKISAALVKAQMEMGNAKKDALNPFFKKSYADLNSVREASLPVLNANGISVIQPTCVIEGVNYVETILLHESGEFISSLTQIVVDKPNDAQRHGSGLSYARRYALSSIVNIGAEDDDANAATGKSTEVPVKKSVRKTEPDESFYTAWQTAINDCDSIAKLTHCYESQKDTVDKDAKLKGMFKERQSELKAPVA